MNQLKRCAACVPLKVSPAPNAPSVACTPGWPIDRQGFKGRILEYDLLNAGARTFLRAETRANTSAARISCSFPMSNDAADRNVGQECPRSARRTVRFKAP